jgi:hypothetical protein
MGKIAARMLLSLLDGRPLLLQNMQIPTELIVRGTTAPPPLSPLAKGAHVTSRSARPRPGICGGTG